MKKFIIHFIFKYLLDLSSHLEDLVITQITVIFIRNSFFLTPFLYRNLVCIGSSELDNLLGGGIETGSLTGTYILHNIT
jgi:hypothetical protein